MFEICTETQEFYVKFFKLIVKFPIPKPVARNKIGEDGFCGFDALFSSIQELSHNASMP